MPEGLIKLSAEALVSSDILETLAPYRVNQNLLVGDIKQLVPTENAEAGQFDDSPAGYLLDFDKDGETELLTAIWYTDDRSAYKRSGDGCFCPRV